MAADIDVSTQGNTIDITAAEFRFNGGRLSAAVESLDYNTKTDEELTFLQGLQDAQERTAGQRTHDGNITWATRQWLKFVALQGGIDNALNNEYTFTVIASPRNDPAKYKFTFKRFRMHSPSGNIDKSAAKTKIACSYLSFTQERVIE